MSNPRDPQVLETMILALVSARSAGKSICPSEVARALDEGSWRALMPLVRRHAIILAMQGKLSILRKGKPVDPEDFKGVYRLALPPSP